jgi:hypothetical protein
LLGPFVLITWLFLTARPALRAKVWRAFRFRHSGLTSVLSTLVLALPDRFPSAQLRLPVMHSFWLASLLWEAFPRHDCRVTCDKIRSEVDLL